MVGCIIALGEGGQFSLYVFCVLVLISSGNIGKNLRDYEEEARLGADCGNRADSSRSDPIDESGGLLLAAVCKKLILV